MSSKIGRKIILSKSAFKRQNLKTKGAGISCFTIWIAKKGTFTIGLNFIDPETNSPSLTVSKEGIRKDSDRLDIAMNFRDQKIKYAVGAFHLGDKLGSIDASVLY